MKKTIVTTMLALGLAASASALSLSDAVLSVPSYENATSYTGVFSTSDGTGNARPLTTLTVVFDWEKLQQVTLTETATQAVWFTDGDANATSMGFKSTDGTINALTMAGAGTTATVLNANLSNYVDQGKLVLTFTTATGNTGTTLYAVKGDSETHQQYAALRWKSTEYDTLNISSSFASAIDSLYVFNNTTSVADIKAISKEALDAAVPEPTTATLSLLALAGLAARRRRK